VRLRPLVAVSALLVIAAPLAACSSSDSTVASTTFPAEIGSAVLTPVVVTPQTPTVTVGVGTVVSFDMGDPGEDSYVANSSDPSVFRVEGDGKTEGTYTTNAGGVAVSPGTVEVAVQFMGSVNGAGTPALFTVTVE
jgi:hypothetical protein